MELSGATVEALNAVVGIETTVLRCTTSSGKHVDFAYVPLDSVDDGEELTPEKSDEKGLWVRAKESDMESHTVTFRTVRNLARRCEPDVGTLPYGESSFPGIKAPTATAD